ncbi:MAG: 3-hydroxyacyl-CoA dehydrogenase NAD-binding domain-containing protein [Gammaproteobacteria bacterium]|nr:3-hydroxyacyl-CoA dehydrogenase NAD-binding domain-containing protein [Gammaproteobacteria bacterium]
MNTKTDFQHWKMETDDSGIAWLGFDLAESHTNTLGSAVMRELSQALDTIAGGSPRAVVVHSLKKNGFAAGADINEFTKLENESQAFEMIRSGQKVLDKLEALPCPTVAMLHGFVLGGGLELALACRYRIAADDARTQLGFPEVKLGIHPGFGGSIRSVNVMGVTAAMKLMLTGRSLKASKAHGQGLVDRLAKPDKLKEQAAKLALSPPSPAKAPMMQRLLGTAVLRPLIAGQLRKQTAAKVRKQHYPAPFAMIDLWQATGARPVQASYEAEAHSIARLMCGETARNLVRVFFLQNRLKSLGRKTEFKLRRVHVIGAGTMGGDIAAWCASRGFEVSVQDQKAEYVEKAFARARKYFAKRLKDEKKIEEAAARLKMDLDGDNIAGADVVIEAIIENREAKTTLLREVETRLAKGAVLATNTSSIPLEELAEALEQPSRLIGLHFFNPVTKMPLVEVIAGNQSADEALAHGLAAVRAMGKLPVPVKSAPGFLVNRILAPYMMAALRAWDEGIALEALDRAAEDFGMPMGPAELADTVGLDVLFAVAEVLKDTVSMEPPKAMHELVEAGKTGRKSGQGLYRWEDGKAVKDKSKAGATNTDLQDRLIMPYLNEAVCALREGIVEDADLLDAGAIFGTGFAPFRGGPIHYARTHTAEFKQLLESLAQQHGEFYRPDAGWDSL